jgi:hypothetical protein
MSQIDQLESRLAAVERELADIKQKLSKNGAGSNWIEQISGSFANDPDFEEIVRLGREYRKSQTFETHG